MLRDAKFWLRDAKLELRDSKFWLQDFNFELQGGKMRKTKMQNRGGSIFCQIGFERGGIESGQVQGVEPERYEAKIDQNSI